MITLIILFILVALAIVGGTNLYNDARGTLTIIRTTHSPRPIRELLYFRLAG